MTSYNVRHRTTYTYSRNVAYSRLIAHLAPRATARQQPLTFDVNVSPWPVERYQRSDFFGNTTNWFTIDEPHIELQVIAQSQVAVEPLPALIPSTSPDWEDVRRTFEFPEDAERQDVVQYVFDTPLTATTPEIVAYAEESFRPGRSLLACAIELNSRVHADFTYDSEATDTRTTVEKVFELRAGVCQDLAHAGLAAVRAMGLAARYVSGYLLTHPAPGHERLIALRLDRLRSDERHVAEPRAHHRGMGPGLRRRGADSRYHLRR
jgi:transglutaminase-like putative cysteine protease